MTEGSDNNRCLLFMPNIDYPRLIYWSNLLKYKASMKAEEKEQIKERIITEIENAREQVIDLEELTQPIAPDAAIGRISRMEAINNKSVNEHLLTKTKSRLMKLEASLAFIMKEDYGICRICSAPIPLGRLMMLPESDRCVDCA